MEFKNLLLEVIENEDSSLASQVLVSRLPSNYLDDGKAAAEEAREDNQGGENLLVLIALGLLFAIGLAITGLCFSSRRSSARQPVKIMAYH